MLKIEIVLANAPFCTPALVAQGAALYSFVQYIELVLGCVWRRAHPRSSIQAVHEIVIVLAHALPRARDLFVHVCAMHRASTRSSMGCSFLCWR